MIQTNVDRWLDKKIQLSIWNDFCCCDDNKQIHKIVLQNISGWAVAIKKPITDWHQWSLVHISLQSEHFLVHECAFIRSQIYVLVIEAPRPKISRLPESGCRWNYLTCTGVVGANRSDIDWTSDACGLVRRKLVHSLRAHHHTNAVSGCIDVWDIQRVNILFVFMWQHMHAGSCWANMHGHPNHVLHMDVTS